MEFFKEHTLLDKQYVSHTNEGISFAFTEYKRSNETRIFALVKEYRPTVFKCSKCGPVVFETAVAFSPASMKCICDELFRLTQTYHEDKPKLGMFNALFLIETCFNLVYMND